MKYLPDKHPCDELRDAQGQPLLTAPDRLVLQSANAGVSMPVCPYPKKPVHDGSGPVTADGRYSCR